MVTKASETNLTLAVACRLLPIKKGQGSMPLLKLELSRSANRTREGTSMPDALWCYARRVAFVLVVLLFPLASQALLLGQHVLDLGYDIPFLDGASSTLLVTVCFSNDPCEPINGFFADHTLSSTDAGSTFIATSASDIMFDAKVQLLTNGVDDDVAIDLQSSNGLQVGPESQMFFDHASGTNGIDFAGFAIDSVDLTLSNDFSVTPDVFSDTTALRGTITLQVFGHVVPEPSTATLVGAGLAGLLVAARGRKGPSRSARSFGTRSTRASTSGTGPSG